MKKGEKEKRDRVAIPPRDLFRQIQEILSRLTNLAEGASLISNADGNLDLKRVSKVSFFLPFFFWNSHLRK